MTRVVRILALLAISVALWIVVGLLPPAAQPIIASTVGIVIGAMVERQSSKALAAAADMRHKAHLQEIGQAAMNLARDLDKANREIEALRGRK